jgi:hypothetical protein
MKHTPLPGLFALVLGAAALSACMSQEARTERVSNRQDRIDHRTSGRQERWEMRAEREDARAKARFDSW